MITNQLLYQLSYTSGTDGKPRIIRQALPRPPRRDRVHVLLRRFAPFAPPLAPLVAGLCPGAGALTTIDPKKSEKGGSCDVRGDSR